MLVLKHKVKHPFYQNACVLLQCLSKTNCAFMNDIIICFICAPSHFKFLKEDDQDLVT